MMMTKIPTPTAATRRVADVGSASIPRPAIVKVRRRDRRNRTALYRAMRAGEVAIATAPVATPPRNSDAMRPPSIDGLEMRTAKQAMDNTSGTNRHHEAGLATPPRRD